MSETTPVAWPPGWYHDPEGEDLLRWWDGAAWTDRTVTPQELPSAARSATRVAPTQAASPSSSSPYSPAWPSPPSSPAPGGGRPAGRLAVAAAVGVGLAAVVLVLVHVSPGDGRGSSAVSLTTGQNSATPSSDAAALRPPSKPASVSASASRPAATRRSVQARTFTDGTFAVPGGVAPGIYHTINRLDDCTWYRWTRVGGVVTMVGQGIGDDGPAVAAVLPGDVQFRSIDCGRWSSAPTGPTTPATQFDQGTFRVGVDIAPGSYAAAAPAGCVWRRLFAFTGDAKAVIAEGHPDGPTTVTILPSDQGFYTIHCGQWHRT